MKPKLFQFAMLTFALLCFAACKKDATSNNKAVSTLNGTWVNNSWGGTSNNTIKFSISTDGATATITQLGAAPYGFSVGDVLYSGIAAAGSNTYTSTGTYRYGTNNATAGKAAATMTLQNNGAQLYVHYAQDPSSGITPPDYYYQKQ